MQWGLNEFAAINRDEVNLFTDVPDEVRESLWRLEEKGPGSFIQPRRHSRVGRVNHRHILVPSSTALRLWKLENASVTLRNLTLIALWTLRELQQAHGRA